jgi:hypothetical protein
MNIEGFQKLNDIQNTIQTRLPVNIKLWSNMIIQHAKISWYKKEI